MKAGSERRREPRVSAHGAIQLVFEDPMRQQVEGKLLDISRSGFRAFHSYGSFRLGQEVVFHHIGAEGKARVMWNRIMPQHVETGFVILQTNS